VNGIIVVDKPAGLSSNRVLGRIKHLLGGVKAGFLGTLDPLATGVLPVFVGKATKLIPLFEGLDKEYRVTLKLGERTDTLDAEGEVVETRPLEGLGEARVREVIAGFAGPQQQTAPAYSAVKHGGVPAYRLARAGKAVPPRVRTVHLSEPVVEAVALPLVTFRVTASAGTYMRTLADDIGRTLGVGAHVTALDRFRCGDLFLKEKSITLDKIEIALARNEGSFLLNPSALLTDFLPITVDSAQAHHLRHGRILPLGPDAAAFLVADKVQAVTADGTLLAIGEVVQLPDRGLGFQPGKVLS